MSVATKSAMPSSTEKKAAAEPEQDKPEAGGGGIVQVVQLPFLM